MKTPKEYQEIVEDAVRQGWRVRETKSGLLLLAPDGIGKVVEVEATQEREEAAALT